MSEIKLDNIKPNSHTYKQEEQRKAEPVVRKEDLVSTKKPLSRKIFETFVNTDKDSIKDWLIWDALVPAIQDIGFGLLENIFFSNFSGGRSSRRRGPVSYNQIYRSNVGSRSSSYRNRGRRQSGEEDGGDYRNICLRTKNAAEDLLDEIYDRIERTGELSVAELLDMVGEPSKYTDSHYGWTDVRDIGIKHVHNGWLIDVAEAKYIP